MSAGTGIPSECWILMRHKACGQAVSVTRLAVPSLTVLVAEHMALLERIVYEAASAHRTVCDSGDGREDGTGKMVVEEVTEAQAREFAVGRPTYERGEF